MDQNYANSVTDPNIVNDDYQDEIDNANTNDETTLVVHDNLIANVSIEIMRWDKNKLHNEIDSVVKLYGFWLYLYQLVCEGMIIIIMII